MISLYLIITGIREWEEESFQKQTNQLHNYSIKINN